MAPMKRWNACANEWCDGTMQTFSVTCGADPGSKEMCSKCGRQVEHGWGPPRVRYEGRRRGYPNPCPVCGAPPFERCRTLRTQRTTDTHMRRVQGEWPAASDLSQETAPSEAVNHAH